MADNTTLNTGTGGDVVATDDIAGVKYQRVKLILGADGVNDGDVSSTNRLPIANIGALTPASGQVTTLGNNTLLTPASGKKLRIYYVSYNPLVAVEAAFRFGAAGALWLRNNITANSVIAKDCGDLRYLEGAVDEVLILNLSLGVAVNWNVFYLEV